MNKYKNKKVEYKGIKFDSQQELDFYLFLLQQLVKGEITEITLQPEFVLIPNYEYQGVKKRGVKYSADFEVKTKQGNVVVYDVKGMETQQGNLRRKMFEINYPEIVLQWVAKNQKHCTNGSGFVNYDELKKIRAKNKKEKAI